MRVLMQIAWLEVPPTIPEIDSSGHVHGLTEKVYDKIGARITVEKHVATSIVRNTYPLRKENNWRAVL